jgi:hypothetical protein
MSSTELSETFKPLFVYEKIVEEFGELLSSKELYTFGLSPVSLLDG